MKKEFVPYELALRMKQLGFDEPCICSYCVVTKWEKPTGEILLQISDTELSERNRVKAPLYQQAFKWFRKNYYFLLHYDYGKVPHCTIIQKLILEDGLMTYEKAEFACLEKLIEIVEQSKSE